MTASDPTPELSQLIDIWEKESSGGSDPIPTLTKLAELVEKETEAYLKKDPDPFDDRHPSRVHPTCSLGLTLKTLFKHEEFTNKLLNNYVMSRDNRDLNTIACRLLLDILPGLETSVVFQDTEGLMTRLFNWAENAPNPLQSYSIGLLAASMEVQDIAANFREKNSFLVPLMLKRLHELSRQYFKDSLQNSVPVVERPFAHLNKESEDACIKAYDFKAPDKVSESRRDQCSRKKIVTGKRKCQFPEALQRHCNGNVIACGNGKSLRSASASPARATSPFNVGLSECSNSSWAELEPLMIGCYQMYPLTLPMQQRFILQYLTPMGEYQELLSYVFEHNALSLILRYINLKENSDVRLAFEALKYLASLLCHKKFAIEFINIGGLQHLLQVHRPSVAATGVSICLYYLAYSEDAMERVCLLPPPVLSDLVRYALWLLECSHDSSRCHATMFFGLTFAFRSIQQLFDEQDGLRKLFNVMSTLDIFVSDPNSVTLSDDQIFASRQAARHVCCALKRYYETHLTSKAEQLRRSHSRNQGSSPQLSVPSYKAARYSNEAVQENIETLLELMPLRMRWEPVEDLLKLDGINLLLKLIGMSFEWNYSGRPETVRSALDVLNVCSVTPKTQMALCESIKVVENQKTVGISIILAAAEGDLLQDPDVQRSALNVIINCVCGPMSRVSEVQMITSVGRMIGGVMLKKKTGMRSGEDLLGKMWNCVRANNGIMILLGLLTVKTPITDADSIRALACKALCGLARCETVKQIVGKLPLFTSGQLQVLMREPVLQDKRQEHVKFCKHCIKLIERITGAPVTTGIESSLCKMNKAEVVAQTKIMYHEKQLLQLMYQHLTQKGLLDTASVLQKEAFLPINVSKPVTQVTPIWTASPVTSKTSRSVSLASSHVNTSLTPINASVTSSSASVPDRVTYTTGSTSSSSTPTPGRISLTASRHMHQSFKANKTPSLQKLPTCSGNYTQTPVMKRQSLVRQTAVPYLSYSSSCSITLDSIVTEYLRKQHSLCKNPVVTCPPFDLFVPHQCPEPQYKSSAPVNMTARLYKREIHPQYGGYDGARMNRKFIYSRFRPVRTFRDSEGSSSFTCCAFSTCEQFLLLGTFSGELKAYNMITGSEEATYTCHDSELIHCEASRDSKLLLTSSAWRRPLSALWNFSERFEMKHTFDEDHYVEFGKTTQDRIIGTKYETAHIYDTATGQLLQTIGDPDLSNNYTKNRATFDPTDELVLSDGVIWDVRCGKPIHKLDKFNPNINGVFHPNGLEIISNSEIWDLRTFHLLHTVPALDQCQITFNHTGDVIYGAMLEEEAEMDEDQLKSPYGSSFRTFDAIDYTSIATIDIRKNIFDLATNKSDCYLAIVENQVARDGITSTESICRLYEVGRCREADDEEGDEEEESDEMDDESEDDDDEEDEDDGENEDGEQEIDNENEDEEEREPMSISDDDSDDDDGVLFAINTFLND